MSASACVQMWGNAAFEFLLGAARNRGWVRRMVTQPGLVQTLVDALAAPQPTKAAARFERVLPMIALYNLVGSDARVLPADGSAQPFDLTRAHPNPQLPFADGTGLLAVSGASGSGEEDSDDEGGDVDDETAAWLLDVFDSQQFARRGGQREHVERLALLLNSDAEPYTRNTASAVMQAGGHEVLVNLLRETAPKPPGPGGGR